MESFTIIEKFRKGEKRKRKDKTQTVIKQDSKEVKGKDESRSGSKSRNFNVMSINEPEKDYSKEHSYAGAKAEKKRRKLSMAAIRSEYHLKSEILGKGGKGEPNDSDASVSHSHQVNKSFKCDKCGSLSITNPMIRGNKLKNSKYMPCPRRKVDPETKKILCLCNACGLAFSRPKKIKKIQSPPSLEEKRKYLDEGLRFAELLAEEIGNKEASRLYCTYYTKTPCGCIQRYIGDDKSSGSIDRTKTLLEIMAKAKHFKSFKVYDQGDGNINKNCNNEDGITIKQKRGSKKNHIGLGNGHKKSIKFEKYVLEQRAWLKKKFGFCETGTKRVLLYSNNFLHKKLKTDPEKSCRVARQKGMAALGKLTSIKDLPKEQCCVDNCVRMASTHQTLLQQWRDRSISGQAEARRVIAEMLTPSGGSRTNCYKFISSVTGCSLTTIGKVNEQMKKTGGNREPPKHGLIKYWKQHPKPKKEKTETKSAAKLSGPSFTKETAPPIFPAATFVHQYGILQAAANSSGLTAVMQGQQQPQQQQGQAATNIPHNNATVITVTAAPYPQSFITIPTGAGNTFAIPMNALQMQNFQIQQQQQFPLIQPQNQQQPQQHSQTIAIAVNQMPNNVRQQVTTPTMVSNAAQNGSFVLASTSSNFMDADNCLPSLVPTQQLSHANGTQASVQLPTQLLLAPAQGTPLMLPNNPSSIISIVPQSQHQPTNGAISVVPATGTSTTEQFLSAENVAILNNPTGNPVPVTQFGQLIQQSPVSGNHSSPIQVSFLSPN